MPTITAFPDTVNAQVRVEVNWADVPAVRFARVLRYNTVTGECVPLRPYICYDGDALLLGCGHGIFFDTEMPLDTEFYYITEGLNAPCIPTSPILLDTFNRTSASTWTTANTGQAYSIAGGVNADYTVTPGSGSIAVTAAGGDRISYANVGTPDHDITALIQPFALPTGASFTVGVATRLTDANNYYMGRLVTTTSGVINLQIGSVVAGVRTVNLLSATLTGFLDPTAAPFYVRMSAQASFLRLKAWQVTVPEPVGWDVELNDASLPTGNNAGALVRRETGNLTPTTAVFNQLVVSAPCDPCAVVSADTSLDPTTIPSGGVFRLRDPVRPCNDQVVPLCFTQANTAMDETGYCIPGNGIFFASMDTEDYEPNTITLNPTNAKYPLAMTRTRRGVSSVLTLVTRTFDDRDNVLTLTAPGSPLFWQGPAAYGIPDQYMDIGRVAIQRGLSDHKFQVRIVTLPYTSVARPAGPSQGVCGSQVQDYCDFTWDELAADGNTWDDLIRGRETGGTTGYRTWTIGANTVLADFADWNAVNNGTRDWIDLEVGL